MYIREAHPVDGARPLRRGALIEDPKSSAERQSVAKSCAKALEFTMPMLIDEMDDRVAKDYGAYPDRLYIIGDDGRVAYRGGRGPSGFRPDEMEERLKELLEGRKRKRVRL